MTPQEQLAKIAQHVSPRTLIAAKTQIEFFESEDCSNIAVHLVGENILLQIDLGICTSDGRSELTIDMEIQNDSVVFFAFSTQRKEGISSDSLVKLYKLSSFFQQTTDEVGYH